LDNEADVVFRAARLAAKALPPYANAETDAEYKSLLAEYFAKPILRQHVDAILRGLDLKLLDVHFERGLYLAPTDQSSKFAYRFSDFRQSYKDEEKVALALAHVAIAAAFFPTSQSIDDDEIVPTTLLRMRRLLTDLSSRLEQDYAEKAESVPPANDAQLTRPGWSLIARLPPRDPEGQRASFNSVFGIVKTAVNHLVETGMLREEPSYTEDPDHETYRPTYRYRAQLRELTLVRLLNVARSVSR
jgi:hypothetical protein